ncbi:treacle protein [Dorcoceras hygrometricum]|uniref:Treacle protein n=1 Tax=Dorcoceras hygrometricum TaxID=472368 RepID=A0A2Z7BW87_9LAMI|nr:treacle protein [Dorcoceras hygrometricum]
MDVTIILKVVVVVCVVTCMCWSTTTLTCGLSGKNLFKKHFSFNDWINKHGDSLLLPASPKRFRRDGKPATERPHSNPDLDKDQLSSDQKHHRRLQDALPLEAPLGRDENVESGTVSKQSEEKANGNLEGSNHSSEQAKVPRSRTYFQHDDRGITRQDGRGFGRRTDSERGWWRDHKAQLNSSSRAENKMLSSDARRKDEKAMDNQGNNMWRHDGYFEMEANPKPPSRKRPSFSEHKITTKEPEKADKSATAAAAANPLMPKPEERVTKGEKREERVHYSRYSDKPEIPFARERESRGEVWRGNFTPRDRYGSSGRYRGRDQFTGRQGYRPVGDGGRVEKWKHDLYKEANRSPTPKNEEDQISKIEALLAS